MKSLDYLKLARDRGMFAQEDCSTVNWLLKVADKDHEDFLQAMREEGNFTAGEMINFVNKLADVVPADVTEMWIRKICADPDAARVLVVFALRWPVGDVRRAVFFAEFIKTFADNPHYYLSQAMFTQGAT